MLVVMNSRLSEFGNYSVFVFLFVEKYFWSCDLRIKCKDIEHYLILKIIYLGAALYEVDQK